MMRVEIKAIKAGQKELKAGMEAYREKMKANQEKMDVALSVKTTHLLIALQGRASKILHSLQRTDVRGDHRGT
jgi:hypothetical protein